MKSATMLYRCPGPLILEGVRCETTVVDECDVDDAIAAGWNRTWHGAAQDEKDAKERAEAALKANEAEQMRIAAELAKVEEPRSELKAVHRGRGVYEVQDAEGNVIKTGLTKEEAHAALG